MLHTNFSQYHEKVKSKFDHDISRKMSDVVHLEYKQNNIGDACRDIVHLIIYRQKMFSP